MSTGSLAKVASIEDSVSLSDSVFVATEGVTTEFYFSTSSVRLTASPSLDGSVTSVKSSTTTFIDSIIVLVRKLKIR